MLLCNHINPLKSFRTLLGIVRGGGVSDVLSLHNVKFLLSSFLSHFQILIASTPIFWSSIILEIFYYVILEMLESNLF